MNRLRLRALTTLIEAVGGARAQVIHLALTLAGYEAATTRDDWRHPTPHPPPPHPAG